MKKTSNFILIFSLFLLAFLSVEASNKMQGNSSGWLAGVSRVNITPTESMWMAGYASRTHPSERKLQDLWAKALVLKDAKGNTAVLVTTDLIGFPKNIADNICNRLKIEYRLSRSQIILNSSHTHSGPVLQGNLVDVYPMGPKEWEKVDHYSLQLEDQIVKVVGKASGALEPVNLFSGNGITRFQVNRRNNNEQKLSAQSELKGPNDYAVPVLKVTNLKGKIVALAFGYACHGTVLNSYEWNGDYPGFAQIELEKSFPGTTALFFQGTAGDQNPIPRRTVPLAQQYGEELASAVKRVIKEEMRPLSPEISTAYSKIELPLENAPTEETLLQLASSSAGYQQNWAKRMLEKIRNGEPFIKSYNYPLQIWKLGNQLVMALGGEPTIEYDLKLKQLFGNETFILGYSNDVMSYIPSEAILREGGYEGKTAQIAYGLPATWKPYIEKTILQGMLTLSEQVGISQTKELQEKLKKIVSENIP